MTVESGNNVGIAERATSDYSPMATSDTKPRISVNEIVNQRRPSTTGRKLRVGLFGCGKMGMQHLRAISLVPETVVVGIADPLANREALKGVVSDDCPIFSDPADLLRHIQPDIVHIVTPPSTHAALATLALESGCHVYIEKPVAPTKAEAESILKSAAERGLLVCAGHQYLFERPALLAQQMLPSIGRVVHVESFFSFRMVRSTITPVEQAKDILPHAVYPIVDLMRRSSGLTDPIEVTGLDTRSEGDVYALLKLGNVTGLLLVSLSGRPVEQYQQLCGTKGWMRADYVTGSLTRLLGPGAGLGVLFTPYRRAFQTLTGATAGFWRLILGRKTSYPGLQLLIGQFYQSVRDGAPCPVSPQSIVDTVSLCEHIGEALDTSAEAAEAVARARLAAYARLLPPVEPGATRVLVTGGTGLLGKRVAEELRQAGFPVRVLSRRLPRFSTRVPDVEYAQGDLARGIDPAVLRDVGVVLHCAAETAGGQQEHERNSIAATRNILTAAANAGIRRFVHVSSLAVLKPGREVKGPLDEQTPIDAGNLERGPYVWGKAESEVLVQRLGRELGVDVKIVRPGPLVDYTDFSPPGRLGREVGPIYVAIGGRRSPLSVCDVGTAARVLRSYVQRFDRAPTLLNLVESPAPARRDLAARLRANRPDLRFVWFPGLLLRLLSGPLKLAQRIALGSKRPIDVHAAFACERYKTDLAGAVIQEAGESAIVNGSEVV